MLRKGQEAWHGIRGKLQLFIHRQRHRDHSKSRIASGASEIHGSPSRAAQPVSIGEGGIRVSPRISGIRMATSST
jgi:hypothetical protein